jgi:hypothetical protein
MPSSEKTRRFPPPWRVERATADVFCVRDANGVRLASVHCRDDLQKWSFGHDHLTSDEARRIANAIARIPEFMIRAPGFCSRGGGDKRWKPSRPYHVALQDWYVRDNWDRITAICAYNAVPFDPTGQRINREGYWSVYEFAPTGGRNDVLGQVRRALVTSQRLFLSRPARRYAGYERAAEP